MKGYNPRENRNLSLKLMSKRLGVNYEPNFSLNEDKNLYGMIWSKIDAENKHIISSTSKNIVGINNNAARLEINGGILQQERMIYDKRRSLDRAVLYSYQAALVKNLNDSKISRALINPDKNKMDYDDKIISIGYESEFQSGDVFEWMGTNTYWLVYLQDIDELAYFKGEIRRCSYEIAWEDDSGKHSTYAAIRGPVETKINFIQKHKISVDEPNHTLNILLPKNKETLEYFRRYSKFYLRGEDEGSPQICWRVEATDWISTPGILEITAVEYFINKTEDDVENGIVGGLIAKSINPNNEKLEGTIVGETFIKPKLSYNYEYKGLEIPNGRWEFDRKYPIELEIDKNDSKKVKLKWKSNYSGQFTLSFGGVYNKTIVVESLF